MNRTTLLALVVLAGCGKWKVVDDKNASAIEGQGAFMLAPLAFEAATVDGEAQPSWLAAQDAEQKTAWPAEQDYIRNAFQKAILDEVGDHLKLTTAENPDGATLTLRPRVVELETGGYSHSKMILGLQVTDASGAVLEEISTKVQGSRRDEFKTRIATAAEAAGEIVGKYLRKRSGK